MAIAASRQRDDFYQSPWYETAPPVPATPPVAGDATCDVAVIGGGYTGLSTALHLAQRGASTIVLEADEIGFGASGRNQGHCTPTFMFYSPSGVVNELGPVWGPRMVEMQTRSAELVFRLIVEHGIECDAVRSGVFQAAHLPQRVDRLKALVDEYSRVGLECRFVERADVGQYVGSPRYYGGWFLESAGNLDPLAFARGLAAAAIGAGASVHSHSAVRSIEKAGSGWRLKTDRATVTADRIVIATDAYSEHMPEELKRGYFLVTSYNLASAPLPPDVCRSLMPKRSHVADTHRDTHFFRLDGHGRFITGSSLSGRRGYDLAYSRQKMTDRVRWIFPDLGPLDWKWYWRGNLGMVPNMLPKLIEVEPGVLTALGYSGRGVPTATAMGKVLAALSLGDDPQEQPVRVERLKPLAAGSLYSFIAPHMLKIYRMRDYLDQRRAGMSQPYF